MQLYNNITIYSSQIIFNSFCSRILVIKYFSYIVSEFWKCALVYTLQVVVMVASRKCQMTFPSHVKLDAENNKCTFYWKKYSVKPFWRVHKSNYRTMCFTWSVLNSNHSRILLLLCQVNEALFISLTFWQHFLYPF